MFSAATIDFPYAQSAEALSLLIPQLRARGDRFATVSVSLAMGETVAVGKCFERTPDDNRRYGRSSARGARQRDAVDVCPAHAVS